MQNNVIKNLFLNKCCNRIAFCIPKLSLCIFTQPHIIGVYVCLVDVYLFCEISVISAGS